MVDVAQMVRKMKEMLKQDTFTAAQVALQMIEGVPRIRFVAGS